MTLNLNQKNFGFFLVIAGTKTIYHRGISAAGADHESLPYTATLDAEYLELGYVKTLGKLPVSPAGIVSPVLITKACLNLTGAKSFVVDAGIFIKPQIPVIDLYSSPSESVDSGFAMSLEKVTNLFEQGREIAKKYFDLFEYLVFGECVVGGTTTALAVLRALGFDCFDMVSSSIPDGNHKLKQELVEAGLETALRRDDFDFAKVRKNPLLAISALGDPMQAVVLGMAFEGICLDKSIVLAGGTQMIAIASLLDFYINSSAVRYGDYISASSKKYSSIIDNETLQKRLKEKISIATTPWIINDSSAKTLELAQMVCPNIKVKYPTIDYDIFDNQIFKAYANGHVKEGVGAGGALLAALKAGVDPGDLNLEISRLLEFEMLRI